MSWTRSSRPLLLVAASGLAREAAEAVRAGHRYEAVGVLDDDPALWGTALHGLPVLGGPAAAADHPDAALVVCAGRGDARERLVARLRDLGIDDSRWATVVHPSAVVPPSCSVGAGSLVLAGCVLTADVAVGRHVVCMPQVTLTHDDVVDDFATLCAGVALGGHVHVGCRAYVGMRAAVRERRRVGADAVLGMGAVAVTDVPAGETWIGVPARPRGALFATAGMTSTAGEGS